MGKQGMSKAFTKEQDDEVPEVEEVSSALPGGKNYITPDGAKKLQAELHELVAIERPKVCEVVSWAAGNGDRSENADYQYGKKRLREIDKRATFLNRRIQSMVVVDPTIDRGDKIFFGATVTIADEEGKEKTYSIVGVDEVEVSLGNISWLSPLGAALLKAHKGDYVQYRTPKGVLEVEVVKVVYKAISSKK